MHTSEILIVGQVYTRDTLRSMFQIMDATLNTGVFRPRDHDSLWLFVTEHKTPDRTQYADLLDGNTLNWDGQTEGRTDRIIVEHKRQGLELLLFYRKAKYEHAKAGFRYEGLFEYASHVGSHPVHFVLRCIGSLEAVVSADLDALQEEEAYYEGGMGQRFTSHYERNAALRTAAVSAHGTRCMACGFDFEETYGPQGAQFIEVHHLHPISSLSQAELVDPVKDMAVVCANCHRMIHRRHESILSLEELGNMIRQQMTEHARRD